MISIKTLVDEVREDLAEGDRLEAELIGEGAEFESSEWAEVRREHLEALLEIALRHQDCHTGWVNLGSVGQALKEAVEARRG